MNLIGPSPAADDLFPVLRWSGNVTGVENRLRTTGTIRFPHLEPGSYRVMVNAAGAVAAGAVLVQKGSEAELRLRF